MYWILHGPSCLWNYEYSTKNPMITDDYRWLQSMITITSSLEKVWLRLRLWLCKKCNRLQSITITIVISPNPDGNTHRQMQNADSLAADYSVTCTWWSQDACALSRHCEPVLANSWSRTRYSQESDPHTHTHTCSINLTLTKKIPCNFGFHLLEMTFFPS